MSVRRSFRVTNKSGEFVGDLVVEITLEDGTGDMVLEENQ